MSDDFGEERANYRQMIAALRNRIESMAVALTEKGLDDVSLKVALAIEDQFAQGHSGGRTMRLAKIQIMIRNAVCMATQGQVAWDAWHPGSCGPEPKHPHLE